ncbi:hypothetical protein [Rhodococcus erythropolis]|uniref:hypothetical protein n=1 Tax=Rhodococcus erythropolis TaxID=1833 RepID=UPI002226BB60|nr:hypothetical protein [Rhodococcus erythropolis]MCW2295293.1 methionine synthase I (cobalamin-dependent) [Rhodococcus erythropolis]
MVAAAVVETNAFGCNLPNLAGYDISHRIESTNGKGAQPRTHVLPEAELARRQARR